MSEFKLRGITIHQAENLYIPGISVTTYLDCEKHKIELEEEESGKVNVFFTNAKGESAKASVSAANIKAYHYYPKAKAEEKKAK